jgi:hypothetical protein
MKGLLVKRETGWMVKLFDTEKAHNVTYCKGSWPLHPYDCHQIQEDSKRFDNIEARIAAYPDVDFRIETFWEHGMEDPIPVAKLVESETVCEYSGLPAVSEYIGDITDEDKIEGILDGAMSVEALRPKEVREQILFLNWLLKHYSTETDDEGFFYYADSTGKEATMLSIVQNYENKWK